MNGLDVRTGATSLPLSVAGHVDRISIPFLRVQERKWLLATVDMVIAAAVMWSAYHIWRFQHPTSPDFLVVPWEWVIGASAVWFAVSWLAGGYELLNADRFSRAARSTLATTVVMWIIGLFATYVFLKTYPRPGLAMAAVALPSAILAWRGVYSFALRRPAFATRVLVVGSSSLWKTLRDAAVSRDNYYHVLGYVDTRADGEPFCLGETADLARLAGHYRVHRIVVSPRPSLPTELVAALSTAIERGVEVVDFSAAYEEMAEKVAVEHAGDFWLAALPTRPSTSAIEELAMRLLDVLGAGVGVVLTALLFPPIAAAILLESGRPIFYSQERLGQSGKPFRINKFRSMRTDAESGAAVWATKRDCRATRVGAFLRRTHLDELPQMWNILRGDMSLVGPRPERPSFTDDLAETIPFYRLRLAVRPGLTGMKQVKVGYAATADEHLEVLRHDLYYIKHRSLVLNWFILARTIGNVLGMKGR